MVERMCLDDKVRLVFDVGPMPRPDTSHDVRWVRSHAGHGGSEAHVLSFIQQQPSWRVTQAGRGGLITVSIRLNLLHMYIASEMNDYTAAKQRLVQHEQGHVPAWERAMRAGGGPVGRGGLSTVARGIGAPGSPDVRLGNFYGLGQIRRSGTPY